MDNGNRGGAGIRDRDRAPSCSGAACPAGFTYLAVLLLLAVLTLGLSSVASLLSTALQREQELELLFVGNQIRQAIGSYYENTPGGAKQFPATLEALLKDERHPVTVRHLRKLYNDPMTGKPDWVLVTRADGRIAGVASRSVKPPLKIDNFPNPLDRDFRASRMLSEWKFVHSPATGPAGSPGKEPGPPRSAPAPAFGFESLGFPPPFGGVPDSAPAPGATSSALPQPLPDPRARR